MTSGKKRFFGRCPQNDNKERKATTEANVKHERGKQERKATTEHEEQNVLKAEATARERGTSEGEGGQNGV